LFELGLTVKIVDYTIMMSNAHIRKKPVVSGTISPIHKTKIDKLVKEGDFASVSDFISQAIAEFLSYNENGLKKTQDTQTVSITKADMELIRSIIHEEMASMNFEKIKK